MEKENQEEKKASEQIEKLNLNDNSSEPKISASLMLK